MRKAFASTWKKVSGSAEYKEFLKDNAGWLDAYCAFRILLHKTGTGDSTKWGKYATYSAKKAAAVLAENREEADYQSYLKNLPATSALPSVQANIPVSGSFPNVNGGAQIRNILVEYLNNVVDNKMTAKQAVEKLVEDCNKALNE